MSYQDILNKKDESIKNSINFINFIKKKFSNARIASSKQGKLIALLNEERESCLELNRTNFIEISKKLSELKKQICFVILDIKDEIAKDFVEKNYEIYIGASYKEPEYLEKIKNDLLNNAYFESRLSEYSANLKADFIKNA